MHSHDDHDDRDPRGGASHWAQRAFGAGGRVLGSAGQALTSAQHLGAGSLAATHLTTEALVAYVDGELGLGAHQRAAAHLAACVECTAEVQAQLQARSAVRGAGTPCTPAGLLGALRRIPDAVRPSPPAPADGTPLPGSVVQDADGAWVSVLRPDRYAPGTEDRDRSGGPRRRGFPLAVLAVSALAVAVLASVPARAVPTAARPLTGSVVGAVLDAQTATSPARVQAVRTSTPARR